jgi:hypothetical protein
MSFKSGFGNKMNSSIPRSICMNYNRIKLENAAISKSEEGQKADRGNQKQTIIIENIQW